MTAVQIAGKEVGQGSPVLIVAEIVGEARRRRIPTGVRGSAAASIVLFSLGVTDIEPIGPKLIFERFRVDVPQAAAQHLLHGALEAPRHGWVHVDDACVGIEARNALFERVEGRWLRGRHQLGQAPHYLPDTSPSRRGI